MKSLQIPVTLLFIITLVKTVECSKSAEFVYQQDLSEHCQRRVISSVFLGRRVMKANAQILHFAQQEVPYTCAISIRAEPGSNIVFVIELRNVTDACHTNIPNMSQVMVYELGETFGGYWGLLPPEMITTYPPTKGSYYTAKTSKVYTEDIDDLEEDMNRTTVDIPYEDIREEMPHDDDKDDKYNYITLEVPLVNVSGILVEANTSNNVEVDEEDFDMLYDVTPRPGEKYSTTLLPIVQFSIYREPHRRLEDQGNMTSMYTNYTYSPDNIGEDAYESNATKEEGSYALDYEFFTPDTRLKYPFLEHILSGKESKKHKEQKYNSNRLLNFRKQHTPVFHGGNLPTEIYTDPKMETKAEKPFPIGKLSEDSVENPSKYIDEIMAALKASKGQEQSDKERDDNLKSSKLLRKIADMNHNFSAYLVQNESMYNNLPTSGYFKQLQSPETSTSPVTKSSVLKHHGNQNNFAHEPKHTSKQMQESNGHYFKPTPEHSSETKEANFIPRTTKKSTLHSTAKYSDQVRSATEKSASSRATDSEKVTNNPGKKAIVNGIEEKINEKYSTKTISTTKPGESGHLVDHESWENLVQAAPALAGLLNKTNPVQTDSRAVNRAKRRRKRFIQAIDIEVAQPRNVTIMSTTRTTPANMFYFTDRQDFAQLVELQDDDLYGRVAMRNMRSQAGALLLDICHIPPQKSRQVFLFNTSRILLTINDFTAKRMTIVVTPARTLTSQESRCPNLHLECQVSGARVCIDSMVACDGVPNCGTYDIYDEDRLLCSTDTGVQHSVYLAAFAFLAVLLTALYTVHYWLGRCVPKVSDAFFIYTDGTENILYLDSIMRSPTGHDEERLFHDQYFMGGMMDGRTTGCSENKMMLGMTKFKNFFKHFGKKSERDKFDLSLEQLDLNLGLMASSRRPHMYSFAECEISAIVANMVDDATQTGESLEMQFLKGHTGSQRPLGTYNPVQEDSKRAVVNKSRMKDASVPMHDDEKSKDSELSMLKFMKDNRTAGRRGTILPELSEESPGSIHLRSVGVGVEREIQNTVYDSSDSKTNLPRFDLYPPTENISSSSFSNSPVESMRPTSSKQATKQLRFNEQLTMISSSDDMDYERQKHRQSTMLGARQYNNDDNREHSAARDFKRFWSTNKGAKKQTPPKKGKSLNK